MTSFPRSIRTSTGLTSYWPRFARLCPIAASISRAPVKCSERWSRFPKTRVRDSIRGPVYGISKVCGFELTRNYREACSMFTVSGILFNHESPRRGFEFVTRKITPAVARIAAGRQSELLLGNLEAKRDWGHAREYVEAMWRMLQAESPDDYVIATGETHSVREFCEVAFAQADLDYLDYVRVDPQFYRPA